MKIINLVKCEIIKNFSIKKYVIILIVFLLSSVLLSFYSDIKYKEYNEGFVIKNNYEQGLVHLKFLKDNNEKNVIDNLKMSYYEDVINYNKLLIDRKSYDDSYEDHIVNNYIIPFKSKNRIIDLFNEGMKEEFCKENINDYSEISFLINDMCTYDGDLKSMYDENNEYIKIGEDILSNNKYYYYLSKFFSDDNEHFKLLLDKKIEKENDFRSLNYKQYIVIDRHLENERILDEKTFLYGDGIAMYSVSSEFPNYERYIKYQEMLQNDAIKNKEILLYSTKYDIKQDLNYYYDDYWQLQYSLYNSSKANTNNVYHLSIVVMLILSITSSKIVSGEHKTGTIKNIVTTPVKRWKIILSKFIYLILYAYLLYFLAFLVLSIYSGFKYGFNDFTTKLIYTDRVIEVNYFLYMFKELIITGIPLVSFSSILLCLSTITLNTSITVGVLSILSFASFMFWYILIDFEFLKYLPFIYFDSGFIMLKSEVYSNAIKFIDISFSWGLIVSIITIILMILLTVVIYNKRDIKN